MRAKRWAIGGGAVVVVFLAVPSAGAAYQGYTTWRDTIDYPPPGERIDVGGRALHVHCAGEGTPTVILEAGGTRGSDEYARVLGPLAQHTRTCAYDRAGMGWSDPSPAPLTAAALTDDLEALVEGAGLQGPFVLVAASGGGVTAELFARRHPEQVVGMVGVDALDAELSAALEPVIGPTMGRRACLAPWLARLGYMRMADPLGRIAELPADEEDVGLALASHTKTWDAVCSLVGSRAQSVADVRAAPPLSLEIPRIVLAHGLPAGLTGAGADADAVAAPIWAAGQARMASGPSGELRVVADSGHHVAVLRPDAVVDAALALVRSGRGRCGALPCQLP